MRFFTYFFTLIFPMLVFASSEDYYVQSFVDRFQEKEFNKSLQILDHWEISQPFHKSRIGGMKAAVYLAMGDIEKSKYFMSEFIEDMKNSGISDPSLDYVIQLYKKVVEMSVEEEQTPNVFTHLCKSDKSKCEQPTGVKLKYWFGVAQILAGIIAAPFSAGASGALILSGTAMTIDAAADALDNKADFERNLNERQRIDPDIQKNSFLNDGPPFLVDLRVV